MARVRSARLLLALLTLVGCGQASGDAGSLSTDASSFSAPTTDSTTTTTTTTPTTTTTTTTLPPPPPARIVTETAYAPFATAGGVTLANPSARVERIGFHQSNHEGAQQLELLPGAVAPITLEDRGRLTTDRTSADVVSDPELEVRSPVTGTVVSAGTYTLYCKYSDDFLNIEPDDHPGWLVKVLHIDGVQVSPGDRVVAGETMIAPRPTQLPFNSDVDDFRTADPAWPHVHIEIVDPSIPNVANPGSGC